MPTSRSLSLLAVGCVVSTSLLLAQAPGATNPAANNPHLGNRDSIRAGMTLYRVRCADCHGIDAGGYRGPDLIAALAGGMTDERLFTTIRKGVPGTDMPPQGIGTADDDILQMVAYLRNLGSVAATERPIGNIEHGQQLFRQQCTTCHLVAGTGGRLGPDLSRIGSSRSRAALVREIRTPSEWVAPNFETVTVVTKDGQRIRGAKKAEDVFSIQIMDTRERLQGYLRDNLQEVIYEKTSLMPAYPVSRLSDNDLSDLVGYLTTLRGAEATAPPPTDAASRVTPQDLLDGLKDPGRWLTYAGDYTGQRHSPLTQITPANVDRLTAQWTFQTGTLGSFSTTQLASNGGRYIAADESPVTGKINYGFYDDATAGLKLDALP